MGALRRRRRVRAAPGAIARGGPHRLLRVLGDRRAGEPSLGGPAAASVHDAAGAAAVPARWPDAGLSEPTHGGAVGRARGGAGALRRHAYGARDRTRAVGPA